MRVIRSVEELRAWVGEQRAQGRCIGFVPTMGNLHAGHYSLIEEARARSDAVIASVFVNPTQFGVAADLARYPRTPQDDAHGLEAQGCDALFLPDVDTMYPFGLEHGVRVHVPGLGDILEGASRPGHFDGVATVVAKLFNLVQPHLAVFGSKDFQQCLVVRRMSRDLGFPVELHAAPIIREASGLAMSSRNQFLSDREREQAAVIHATLLWMCDEANAGRAAITAIEAGARDRLIEAGLTPDYATLRRVDDLSQPIEAGGHTLVALIAAQLGTVRLIDNRLASD
jgi:pantoate--beta-alanine ligase